MDKGVEELIKLLMELREFYDSMINPFIPVISLHIKGLEGENKTHLESNDVIPFGKETKKLFDSQANAPNFGSSKGNLIKNAEGVKGSSLPRYNGPIHAHSIYPYTFRFLSFLLGNGAREIFGALNESHIIENRVYKSLIEKLELMQSIRKMPEPLCLILSTYLLTSNFDERSMIIIYSLLSKRMQRVGFNNERS